MDKQNKYSLSDTAEARRDFLRKSVYAACATPIIMSLLVEKADAAQSWNPGRGVIPPNEGTPPDRTGHAPNNNKGHGPPIGGWPR